MEWTWEAIIRLALVRSGLVGLGQIPGADMFVIGRDTLCLLLDEWDGQGMALPNFDADIEFDTVAGQAQYLLGQGTPTAYAVRPETIITATVNVSAGPVATWVAMAPMPYPDYRMIPVPSTSGQPWNYAVNETWPQMELWLYPVPVAIYPVRLTCKVKWADTVGDPDLNPFSVAEVPSGYANALVDVLALKLAEVYRLDTSTLQNKARNAKTMVALAVANQARNGSQQLPIGMFSWNILTAGRNP